MEDLRKPVARFAAQMERGLQNQDKVRGKEGRLGSRCSIQFLISRLEEELEEAKIAYKDCDPDALQGECIDIANFAMMIYDRIQTR